MLRRLILLNSFLRQKDTPSFSIPEEKQGPKRMPTYKAAAHARGPREHQALSLFLPYNT